MTKPPELTDEQEKACRDALYAIPNKEGPVLTAYSYFRHGYAAGLAAGQQGNGDAIAQRRQLADMELDEYESCVGDPPAWESPLMPVYQAAIGWTLERLAGILGVKTYDSDAASETMEGDTDHVICNIIRAAGVPAGLFEAIKHGDETHQTWLKAALTAFYADEIIPPPPQPAEPSAPLDEGRVIELAKQAGVTFVTPPRESNTGDYYWCKPGALQRFAELIARELRGKP